MSMAKTATPRQYKHSLARNMLFTLLLLTMAPLLLMGSMAYWRSRGLLRDQTQGTLKDIAETQAKLFVRQVDHERTVFAQAISSEKVLQPLQTLLSNESTNNHVFQESRQNVITGLQDYNKDRTHFTQYAVIRPDGLILAATSTEWEGQSLSEAAYQEFINGQSGSLAGDQLPPFSTNSFVLLTSVPVYNTRGDLAATIFGIIEATSVRAMMDPLAISSNQQFLLTRQGKLFGGSTPEGNADLLLHPLSPTQNELLLTPLEAGSPSGSGEMNAWDGTPVLAGYTWVPDLNVGWVVEANAGRVYGAMNSLLPFAIILLAATIVFTAGTLWMSTRYLFHPLIELTTIVKQFAAGQWEQRARIRRSDEVGLLADSFNQMATEISDLYRSLEFKVEERTRQIRTTAEVSQIAISSTSLDELLSRTLSLVRQRFNLDYVALYQADETGEFIALRKVMANEGTKLPPPGYKLRVDAHTPMGRSVGSNRTVLETLSRISEIQRDDLLVDTVMEGCIPIAVGTRVLAVLHAQCNKPGCFSQESLLELQTLANQIAPALQSFNLLEATQINLHETGLLYQSSQQVNQAESDAAIFEIIANTLRSSSYWSALLIAEPDGLRTTYAHTSGAGLPEWLAIDGKLLIQSFPSGIDVILSSPDGPISLPKPLLEFSKGMNCHTLAFLPVRQNEGLAAILLLGVEEREAVKRILSPATFQPYISFAGMVSTALKKLNAERINQKHAAELRTLDVISQAISVETELEELYRVLHQQINSVMGEVDFLIALYDKETNLIQIPYVVEAGEQFSIAPFPYGEGLTSILIRTRQPLLLVHDTQRQASALGAKVVKGMAKSWLGVPLLLSGEPIGALVLQDMEREGRFTEDDQSLMITLARQVAVAVRNVALLASTRKQAESESLVYEITSKLHHTTDMQRILQITAEELGKALRLRRTHIQVRMNRDEQSAGGTSLEHELNLKNEADSRSQWHGREDNGS